jgi:predicted AlkP superfamily phosphohydrolase/phosphomutase
VKAQAQAGHRYFTVPHNDNAAAIRINLAGRDPYGIVAEGQAYLELCEELSQRLLKLRDATGERAAVGEVVKVHERYSGPEIGRLPDLLVVWNRDADLSAVGSDDIGFFHKEYESLRSGDHSPRGLVLSDKQLTAVPPGRIDPTQVTPILVGAAQAKAVSRPEGG